MKQKYEHLVREHLSKDEQICQKGLRPEDAEALRERDEQLYK